MNPVERAYSLVALLAWYARPNPNSTHSIMSASPAKLELTLTTTKDEPFQHVVTFVALKFARDPSESVVVTVVVVCQCPGSLSYEFISVDTCFRIFSLHNNVRSLQQEVFVKVGAIA